MQDGLLFIGGWEAYETAHRLFEERANYPAFGVPIVCLPATIDNNLPGTELSIGADTALNNIVDVVDKIKQSAVAEQRCYVVEVMGRRCGYLALMSGLATGAERVYLHEEGVTLQRLVDDLAVLVQGFSSGKRLGLMIRSERANDVYDTRFMCALFEQEGGGLFDVRESILGHLQQGGDPSPFDRIQATRLARLGIGRVASEALAGRADWDRHWPRLRTFSLLWVVPVSVYSITYHTVDSQIYLLPVIWMAALWFANGLAVGVDWLQRIRAAFLPGVTPPARMLALAALVATGLIGVAALRLPEMSLRHDRAAQDFLTQAAATLEPNSLVISRSDAQTFALWYGVWGSDALDGVPGLVLINDALYHFDWYRRLLADLYPQVPGIGGPFNDLLRANAALRPIFLAEPLTDLPGAHRAAGPFWRLEP